jgi:hypothetical protein
VEEAVVTPAVLTDPGALEMHFQPIAMLAISGGSLTMTEPA